MLLSHSWTVVLRLATLAVLCAAAACHTVTPPDLPGSKKNPCAAEDIKGCEAALLAAPGPGDIHGRLVRQFAVVFLELLSRIVGL